MYVVLRAQVTHVVSSEWLHGSFFGWIRVL
jgi:hypothetical protein